MKLNDKLNDFFHWKYGDTLTNILVGTGYLLMFYTLIIYLKEHYLNRTPMLFGIFLLISGILYKELIFDKKKI